MSIFCSSTSTFYSLLSALFSHTTFSQVGTKAKSVRKWWECGSQRSWFKEWEELVADAASVGDSYHEEHEWNTYNKLLTQVRRDVFDAARRANQVVEARQKANTQAQRAMGVSEAHQKAISNAIKAKWEHPVWKSRHKTFHLCILGNVW